MVPADRMLVAEEFMAGGVQYCSSLDGTRLGYSVSGTGRPLVIVPGWWMSPEADSRRLIGRDFWNNLPAGYRSVTYDRRGIGVSAREVGDISLERQVEDLCAIVDHLKLSSFDLWCFGDGAAAGVTLAASQPGRVEHLVLYTPWAFVPRMAVEERTNAWAALIRADWGLASRAFAQMLYPKGPLDAQEASTKAIRETQTPEMALRYLEYVFSYDIRDELAALNLPALVISREGPGRPPLIPFETVQRVAAAIPGARFVAYERAAAACPYYDSHVYRGVVYEFLAGSEREMPLEPRLTAREIEVLQLVAEGLTNAEIADLLVISKNTADRHVSNILTKTGSSNRAQAVLYAARHSLVG